MFRSLALGAALTTSVSIMCFIFYTFPRLFLLAMILLFMFGIGNLLRGIKLWD